MDRHYKELLARLDGLRRRALLLELAAGLVLAAAVGLGLLWLWVGLEAIFYLPPHLRFGGGLAALVGVLAIVGVSLARRLPGVLSRQRFSRRVEQACPELGQRLVTALELWPDPQVLRFYSSELLAATVAAVEAALQRIDRRAVLDLRLLAGRARYLAVAAAFFTLTLLFSDALREALYRCAHPLTPFVREPSTLIAVLPGDQQVVRGEDAAFTLHFSGRLPRSARILRRESGEESWQEEELIVDRADSLRHSFKEVRNPLVFQIRAGDGRSPVHRIEVIEPPSVRRLRLEYHYPAYSGLPLRREAEGGDIHALAGTVVHFEVVANKALETATLVLNDTLRLPARVEDDRAFASLQLESAGHYHFELSDLQGVSNRNPIRYNIGPVADEFPQVAISDPGRDLDLPENMQVLLVIEAIDDFGIESVWLAHRINQGKEVRQALDFDAGRQVNLTHLWDLAATELLPEDRIYYRIEVFDNDRISGPKKGSSREYALRFPSLYELYEEATQVHEERLSGLEKLVEEGRQVGDYLERMRRTLLRREELSWEQKKELEATLEREAERAKAVEELAEELQKTVEQLEEKGLSSGEILEKLSELRRLMSEVISPELHESLEALQQALASDDPQQLAEALRQFNQDQHTFQDRLDQTIALLEQVHVEQRLEAAVQQAGELERRQAQINQELEKQGIDGDRLPMQEGSLQRDTQRLQQELGDLSREMARFSESTAEQLQSEAASMEQQNLSGRMEQMMRQLEAGAERQAGRQGARLEADLKQLSANMQQLQSAFVAEQKNLLAGHIRQAMHGLLSLSHRQEELSRRADGQSPAALQALAEEQFALGQGAALVTDQLGDVGRQTMALEHGLAPTLGYALRTMNEAAVQLGQQNALRAAPPQADAMRYLNEAVLLLRESLENLAQARMPSSFGEAMQRMLGLAEQQAQLNEASQQALGEGQQPGQGGSMQRQLPRLGAQQRQIFEALEELRRAVRGHRGAEQRIGAIEQEMQQVVDDLQRQRLTPRTLDTQQRVLQRMLDASRSIHTQGVDEERRRSETGEDLAYAGPSWLPDDLGQSYDRLREAMRHAMEGLYPDEYRPLIQRYYEQLYQDTRHDGEE